MRIAVAQFDVKLGKVGSNFATAAKYIRLAARAEADLVLLPELWSSGYDLECCQMHAQASKEKVLPGLADLAKRHRLYIVGSVLTANARHEFFNSAVLIGPHGGRAQVYQKVHLFGPMSEPQFLAPGRTTPIFQMPFGATALAICYDLRFPELFRKYALRGAQLVLVCAQWPAARVEHWRTLVRARAIENQLFVVACNRVGTSEGTKFGGHSMIVSPWGEILCEGNGKAALLTADIDFNDVSEARSRIPALNDRRPALY
jgi:omega-amidase